MGRVHRRRKKCHFLRPQQTFGFLYFAFCFCFCVWSSSNAKSFCAWSSWRFLRHIVQDLLGPPRTQNDTFCVLGGPLGGPGYGKLVLRIAGRNCDMDPGPSTIGARKKSDPNLAQRCELNSIKLSHFSPLPLILNGGNWLGHSFILPVAEKLQI